MNQGVVLSSTEIQIAEAVLLKLAGGTYPSNPKEKLSLRDPTKWWVNVAKIALFTDFHANVHGEPVIICPYCKCVLMLSEVSVDHINPRLNGGKDYIENLHLTCVECNKRKGGVSAERNGIFLNALGKLVAV